MAFPTKLSQLCTPAYVYFNISILAIVIAAIQNMGNNKRYSVGLLSTDVPNTFFIFIVKIIYVLFWTWILNLICKDGHKEIAWFLVLIPFLLIFIIIGLIMLESNK